MDQSRRGRYIQRAIFVAASFFVVGILLVIVVFIILSTSSVKGEVKKSPRTLAPSRQLAKPLVLKGQYFSISYPASYATANTKQRDTSAIEQYQFTANTVYDKRLAITVVKIPDGIKENSAYKYRTLYADTYAERQIAAAGGPAFVMAKLDKKEQALFVPKGNLMAIIVLVSDGGEDLGLEIENITKSFQWL